MVGTLGLSGLALHHAPLFSFWHNGHVWSPDDTNPRQLNHGDHVEAVFAEDDSFDYQVALVDWLLHQGLTPWAGPHHLLVFLLHYLSPLMRLMLNKPVHPCSADHWSLV